MKPKSLRLVLPAIALCATPATLHAAPVLAYDGVHLDSSGSTVLESFEAAVSRKTAQLYSTTGGIFLATDVEESLPGNIDGGINLFGNPVTITLARRDGLGTFHTNDPLFAIQESETWSSVDPIFQVNGATRASTFTDSDVAINDGSLKIDGNNVLTASSAATAGFIQTSSLTTALNGLTTPPSSSAWKAAYVATGSISGGAYVALGSATASGSASFAGGGSGTTASGSNSIAFGANATASALGSVAFGSGTASASYSFAHGLSCTASGNWSRATGNSSTATQPFAMASGQWAKADTQGEIAFGRYNAQSVSSSSWNDEDALFRLGNGTGTTSDLRSDALTVLKNGRATIINKAWDEDYTADPDTALDDPSSTTDSEGEALVVRGHTRLKGKVVIEVPQGGISMGLYE